MKPNVVFVFADQLRASALGFSGDPNVHTPNLDRLAMHSVHFKNAISGCPVCSPARASLMTGQYPNRHGVFLNNVMLHHHSKTLADCFTDAGYQTAYIGKWHLYEKYRSGFIPKQYRLGFNQYWKVLNCTHDYQNSYYYDGNDTEKQLWEEYDAIAQTKDAVRYIENRDVEQPFLMMLSWGPPHAPYDTAPEKYKRIYEKEQIQLPPNVPVEKQEEAREILAGYYAHISALDDMIGYLFHAIKKAGIEENTIFVFWSDHGDMCGSHGVWKKQYPFDESIKVPLLIHAPSLLGQDEKIINVPINAVDLMPTLLDLCGLPLPETVQGRSYLPILNEEFCEFEEGVLIACYHPFGQYSRKTFHGKEYRGVRTTRYTYVEDLDGPWLLYDNEEDPFQMRNLVNVPMCSGLQGELKNRLEELMTNAGDDFLPSDEYLDFWGYEVNEEGVFPYEP